MPTNSRSNRNDHFLDTINSSVHVPDMITFAFSYASFFMYIHIHNQAHTARFYDMHLYEHIRMQMRTHAHIHLHIHNNTHLHSYTHTHMLMHGDVHRQSNKHRNEQATNQTNHPYIHI